MQHQCKKTWRILKRSLCVRSGGGDLTDKIANTWGLGPNTLHDTRRPAQYLLRRVEYLFLSKYSEGSEQILEYLLRVFEIAQYWSKYLLQCTERLRSAGAGTGAGMLRSPQWGQDGSRV